MSAELSNWFVKDEGDIAGPLTEAEMRQLVMQSSRRSLFVRQGTSAWHPAEVIRNKITALANNGIYVLTHGIAEGPFTFTKAYEVLQVPTYADAEVRTGLNGDWFPAHLWLAKVEELKRERELQNEHGPMSGTMTDVAKLASKFLEQLDNPGANNAGANNSGAPSLALSTFKTRPTRNAPFSSKTAAVIACMSLVVAGVGFAGWTALHAYQCRHIAPQYRIDARHDPESSAPKRATYGSMKLVSGQLYRPTFITTRGQVKAGTAFAANVPGRDGTLIVSALQLLCTTGGLSTDIPPSSVTQQWTGLTLKDILNTDPASDVAMRPVTFSKSAPFPDASLHGDIIVCELTGSDRLQKTALPLLSRSLQVGEQVWLLADVTGTSSLFHAAVISSIEDGWVVYTFDENNLQLQATNGAPIIDRSGSVVAVNAAGGEDQGKTFGVGTPVAKFYDYLLSEL